jgi:endonuclease/exonuclease/phosphatase family metal-dependent hydrolase
MSRHTSFTNPDHAVPHQTSLIVATLNLHWGRGANGTRFDIVSACASLDADVIALQEQTGPPGGSSAAALIAEELGYQHYETVLSDRFDDSAGRWIGSAEPSGGTWGMATLTRLPIIRTADVTLGRARRDPERQAQVVLLAVGTSAMRIVNAHLVNRPPASVRQLYRLRRLLAADAHHPTVVLGDLNVPGFMATAMTGYETASRAPTWPARRPVLRLDNVLIRGCAVTGPSGTVTHVGSDHRAVRAEVRLLA